MSRAVAFAMLGLVACDGVPTEHAQCDAVQLAQAATVADRKLLGVGGAYPANAALRARDLELRTSMKARRDVAWATVAKVVAPVPLAHSTPNVDNASVPLWQTWYGKDDIHRMFVQLYSAIDPALRLAHEPLDDGAIDEAFGWNATALDSLDNWNDERWAEYLDGFADVQDIGGLGGIDRVRYSPSAARHVMRSYPSVLDCAAAGVPPEVAEGADPATQQVVREPIALANCATRDVGPLFAAAGSTLTAQFEGPGAVTLQVRDEGGEVVCVGENEIACDVSAAGRFAVAALAGPAGATGVIAVDYAAPNPEWSACLGGAFPVDTVVVKTAWRRADLGEPVPTFDTSAAALTTRLAAAAPDWEQPDGQADPNADDIYTMRLSGGSEFRLAGMHIMTKELDHWVWITLWWSPEPDTDFGADRPADIDGVWRNYKMCVATSFAEGDADPATGHPATLADAIAATTTPGAPTWCSNPYLERGAGNANTNCIGCHQHAGTHHSSETILAELPAHGSTELRNNFPTDYSWAIDAGDNLGILLADIVQFYDAE